MEAPALSATTIKDFGQRLQKQFEQHQNDRKAAEDKWLQNLRQFRGIYDPKILSSIPDDRSKAYPKLTRWKVIGTVARLMQMLFPQTEKNYGLKPSPLPNLSLIQLQEVLDKLVAEKAQAQQIPPAQVRCTDKEIEDAIYKFALEKAHAMERKIDDDLQELEYTTIARRVVFSAALYNVGVVFGPTHKLVKRRTWSYNEFNGKYEAVEENAYKPLLEFVPVWEWYPDMSAKCLPEQDGTFRRHVMTRSQVEELAERPDFDGGAIRDWLRQHPTGNHTPLHWETEMRGEKKSDRQNVVDGGRKYVVVSYWGAVTGHELQACGVKVNEDQLASTFQANVWLIDNTVIKARLAPFGVEARMYHEFVFEEDDLSLLGNGQCDTLRDSQLSVCEMARMFLDEASLGGENIEVNVEMLLPGQDTNPRSHKVWQREGLGASAQARAVQPVQRQTRLAELQAGLTLFKELADNESGLPPPSLGDVSQGGSEALRTQGNASMFLGAAALPIRDTVRNFDIFTISLLTALVKWNTRYDPNPNRDGDYDVIARGSTSLIAKEVLAASLDNFRATVSEDELPHLNTRKLLEARAKSRDIPVEDILLPEDEAEARIQQQAQAAQQAQAVQEELIRAQVQREIATAVEKIAKAKGEEASVSIETLRLLTEALNDDRERETASTAA